MSVMQDLLGLSAAEEFFDYLKVPYEKPTLDVCRLHILRRLSNLLKAEPQEGTDDDDALRTRFREHLIQAYRDLTTEGPLERRLFKVHQDAAAPKAPGSTFVPLSVLTEPKPNESET